MKKFFLDITIFGIVTFILIEISSIILIKFNILPNGITPSVTLVPNKEYGFWHHKNRSFKLASPCWNSKVSYNNYGLRNTKNTDLEDKNKKRIGIIGDSMSENIEVSDGKDFGSLLQLNLPDYEILNFSTRSTGLGDQLELYKGFSKNFNLDYIFLFISDNDFEDNYYLNTRPSQIKYKLEGNTVKKIPVNLEFFENQKKFVTKLKKERLLFVKEKLNSFILYSHIIGYIKFNIYKKKTTKVPQNHDDFIDYDKKKVVYSYLVNEFKQSLNNNEKLFVFVNLRPKILSPEFYPEKQNIKEMKNIWGKEIIDPREAGINFLKKIGKYDEPYFSFVCDGHYSQLGAKFMADYVSEYFLKN